MILEVGMYVLALVLNKTKPHLKLLTVLGTYSICFCKNGLDFRRVDVLEFSVPAPP